MADLVVANGTVVIPGEVPRPADLSITGERIAGIHEPGLAPEAAEQIQPNMILGMAFAEAIGIYALVVAVMVGFVF